MSDLSTSISKRNQQLVPADTARRAFDLIASTTGIVVFSPLLLLAAVTVKLSSRGPVLFRQRRVGRNFQEFTILKFRTMTVDAPQRGLQITAGGDHRITRVGHILRRSKIDELPQLFNVVRGDMSLVGPRPEVRRYVEMFREEYQTILQVRPGITDLASIAFRNESELLRLADDPEQAYIKDILPCKLRLSRQYVERATFRYDLAIIFRTLIQLFR